MQPWWSIFDFESSQTTDKIVYISLAAAVDSKFDWEKLGKVCWNNRQQFIWTKKVVENSNSANWSYLIMRVLWSKTRMLRGLMCSNQSWARLDSPSRWIGPSTREYLQASNIFVWYIANSFVCWLSWEFVFMNLFKNIAFAHDCCCWCMLLAASSS